MQTVKNYLSLIKFSHTIFAMPFAMIGFFLGWFKIDPLGYGSIIGVGQWNLNKTVGWQMIPGEGGEPIWWKLFLVILCMILARSAAMAFNRYLDRHFDAKNPRTAIREIPSGIISANSALIFTIACSLLFILTCFFLNPINHICFYLSPIALFIVLGYSYTKRFTALCHLILGLGLSLAPIGAYLAVTSRFDLLPILFSFTVLFWVSGFDIIYALQDTDFDRSQKLYSIPASLGNKKALAISRVLHIFSFGCVVAAGRYGDFGLWYWIGVAIFAGMLLYQHSIVKSNDLRRVNLAFMTANGIASVVFAIFVITDMYFKN